MVKAVISDLGNVIIFFDNQIFYKKMTQYCPFTHEDIEKLAFAEVSLIEAFDRGEIKPVEFYTEVVRKLKAKN